MNRCLETKYEKIKEEFRKPQTLCSQVCVIVCDTLTHSLSLFLGVVFLLFSLSLLLSVFVLKRRESEGPVTRPERNVVFEAESD
jgi:hypothetical protein